MTLTVANNAAEAADLTSPPRGAQASTTEAARCALEVHLILQRVLREALDDQLPDELRFVRSQLRRVNKLWLSEVEHHSRKRVVVGSQQRLGYAAQAGPPPPPNSVTIMLNGFNNVRGRRHNIDVTDKDWQRPARYDSKAVTRTDPTPQKLTKADLILAGAVRYFFALSRTPPQLEPQVTNIADLDALCTGLTHFNEAVKLTLKLGHCSNLLDSPALSLVKALKRFGLVRVLEVSLADGTRPVDQVDPAASAMKAFVSHMPQLERVVVCGLVNNGPALLCPNDAVFGLCHNLCKLEIGVDGTALGNVLNGLLQSLRELKVTIMLYHLLELGNVGALRWLVAPLATIARGLTRFELHEATLPWIGNSSEVGLLDDILPLMVNIQHLAVHPAHVSDLVGAIKLMGALRGLALLGDASGGLAVPSVQDVTYLVAPLAELPAEQLEYFVVDEYIMGAWRGKGDWRELCLLAAGQMSGVAIANGDVRKLLRERGEV